MGLVLDHRWEHALIAATVATAADKHANSLLGRTAIQKLLYFMQVLEVPMNYSFGVHHYGPFCSSIMQDTDWLVADGVIEDRSSESRYSNYRPGPAWPELQGEYEEQLSEFRPLIESVCNALGDMRPEELELISTLVFAYRWVRARGGTGPWKEDTVEKFKQIKKDRFSDEQIDEWYGRLAKAGLIED